MLSKAIGNFEGIPNKANAGRLIGVAGVCSLDILAPVGGFPRAWKESPKLATSDGWPLKSRTFAWRGRKGQAAVQG